jgi:hypothetical protein
MKRALALRDALALVSSAARRELRPTSLSCSKGELVDCLEDEFSLADRQPIGSPP